MQNLNNLVRGAMMAALAIGLGFALLLVPNIELVTVTVFLAGLTLGARWGLAIGFTAEFIFSALNPLGSGLAYPPVLIAQVLGMMIAGLSGGLLRPVFLTKTYSTRKLVAVGLTGFFITLIFDLLTSMAWPIGARWDLPQAIGYTLSGAGLLLLHQITNAVVFVVGIPKVVRHLL